MTAGKLARFEAAFDHQGSLFNIKRLADELIDRSIGHGLDCITGGFLQYQNANDVGMRKPDVG